MKHKISLNRVQGFRGMEVESYEIDPPLPEDSFTYLLRSWNYDKYDEGVVELETSASRVVEGTALIKVSLGTTMFVREENGLVPVKQLSIPARVKALRYGGRPSIYRGFMDINRPTELPLEVLEWKIRLEYGNIAFESWKKGKTSVITPPPSLWDVFREEKKIYPHEPFAPVPVERFFFERWLKDNTLTQEMVRDLYEKEILVPYKENCERYENEVAQQVDYYNGWLREKGVILMEIQEIWEYLQGVILPDAGLQVEKEAKAKLQEVGHLELLDSCKVSQNPRE